MSKRKAGPPLARTPTRRDALNTQRRLLDAAGRLFAARGFEGTGVRQICDAAGVNISAVRHHFGSKVGLYDAVVVQSHRDLLQRDPMPRLDVEGDPAGALYQAVEHILRVVLVRKGAHPYAAQLLARELRDPTPALDHLLEHVMKPVRSQLARIVGTLLEDADTPQLRGHCTNFVLGLCVFHELGQEALRRFGFPPPKREADVPPLARMIASFALAGIRRLRETSVTR